MSAVEKVTEITKSLPTPFQIEALHYVEYLLERASDMESDGLSWSYDLLAEDWLSPRG